MKILLDENLPHRLSYYLGSHEVFTVRYQGWSGLENGELLRTAENDSFEVFLTGDQTMCYEQNPAVRQIAVVVLSAIEWHIIRHSLLMIQAVIDAASPGTYQAIEWGLQSKISTAVSPWLMLGRVAGNSDDLRLSAYL